MIMTFAHSPGSSSYVRGAAREKKERKKKDSASVPVAFVRENECHAFHFSLHVREARRDVTNAQRAMRTRFEKNAQRKK